MRMRISTPQIAFHGRDGGKNDPILSVDFHPFDDLVVTAGSDNEIKLWGLDRSKVEESPFAFLLGLSGHTKSVNVVRFSPNGKFLASASDDGLVCVWKPSKEQASDWKWKQIKEDKDVTKKSLRGHGCDVYDIAWSRDSLYLVSGAVDGQVFLWDTRSARSLQSFCDHSHYVQGVAWDPYQNFFISESSDRSCKVYKVKLPSKKKQPKNLVTGTTANTGTSNEAGSANEQSDPVSATNDPSSIKNAVEDPSTRTYKLVADICRRQFASLASDEPEPGAKNVSPHTRTTSPRKTGNSEKGSSEKQRLSKLAIFMDDSLPSFFRRLTFSPDGLLVFVPAGCYRDNQKAPASPTVYVYIRGKWTSPAAHLPGMSKSSVAVRCNPLLFTLRRENDGTDPKPRPWVDLPYRIVFAVVTLDSVLVYDTQHHYPIAAAEQLHYAQLTDLTWSSDGKVLLASSSDGYCSVLNFDGQQLGEPLTLEQTPPIARTFADNGTESDVPDLVPESPPVVNRTTAHQDKLETTSPDAMEIDETRVPSESNAPASDRQKRRIAPTQVSTIVNESVPTNASKTSKEALSEAKGRTKTTPRRIQPTLLTTLEKSPDVVPKVESMVVQEQASGRENPECDQNQNSATKSVSSAKKRRIEPVLLSPLRPQN